MTGGSFFLDLLKDGEKWLFIVRYYSQTLVIPRLDPGKLGQGCNIPGRSYSWGPIDNVTVGYLLVFVKGA